MFYYKFIVCFFFFHFAINYLKILFVLGSEGFNECYHPILLLLLLLLLLTVWELLRTLSSMQHVGQLAVAAWVDSAVEEQKLNNTDPFVVLWIRC